MIMPFSFMLGAFMSGLILGVLLMTVVVYAFWDVITPCTHQSKCGGKYHDNF
nr:MAG TPA: protein of unknown function (DUF883) [Caudoviricetes sp.]